jgi:hypothetical protein
MANLHQQRQQEQQQQTAVADIGGLYAAATQAMAQQQAAIGRQQAANVQQVGPGGLCSPRHRLQFE